MQIKIDATYCQRLLAARTSSNRRNLKRGIFSEIRSRYNVPTTKFVVFVEDPSNPLYGVLRSKYNKQPLDDGQPAPAAEVPVAPAKAVVKRATPTKKAAVKVIAKAPAKKTAAKPAAKKAAPAKAPAKKAAAKPVAKKAAPAKKPATKTVAKRK